MADYSNIPLGLKTTTQIPIDVKTYVQNESTLINLGVNNNLAYTYQKGALFYCINESTRYEWREVVGAEQGRMPVNFVYPNNIISFGIDYSNKAYNFFRISLVPETFSQVNADWNSTSGASQILNKPAITTQTLQQVLTAGYVSDKQITFLVTGAQSNQNAYQIQFKDNVNRSYALQSNGLISRDSAQNNSFLQLPVNPLNDVTFKTPLKTAGTYTLATTIDVEASINAIPTNLQKIITTSYTISNADNNYTIIINNAATNVTITIPSGLMSKIAVGFIQKGTGDVVFAPSGTFINNPIGLKIKGQYYQAFIEQELSTNTIYLLGNTKV